MASKKHLDISKKYCYQSQVSAVALLPPSSVGPSLDLGRLQGKNSRGRKIVKPRSKNRYKRSKMRYDKWTK